MRVMVLVKASPESETGEVPSKEDLAEMGKFNDELTKAGVLLVAEGLRDTSLGKRVRFSDQKNTTVLDGPFTETKELVAGFWLWEVASMDEAVEWIKKAPFQDTTIELRQVFEAEDFADTQA